MSLFDHKISELKELLHKKELSVSDLVDESYKRIHEVDGKVQAFLALDEEKARAYAKELDGPLVKRTSLVYCSVCRSVSKITS